MQGNSDSHFTEKELEFLSDSTKLFSSSQDGTRHALISIAQNEKSIVDIPREVLISSYQGLKSGYDFAFFQNDWVDDTLPRSILSKYRHQIHCELKRRRHIDL
jgi:hypothetical protein